MRATMSFDEAVAKARQMRGRIVEVGYVRGEVRLNLVMPNRKPRTLKAKR